jgi:hypothetical protein
MTEHSCSQHTAAHRSMPFPSPSIQPPIIAAKATVRE